jgi:uncharacterized protein (DUF2344 family)
MPRTDPYKCKSCGYVFVAPKLYMTGGNKVEICPFCDGKEIEEFEIILDEEELNVLGEVLEKSLPDIPPEKIEKIRGKVQNIMKLIEKGEFDIRVKKAESKL